MNEIQPNGIIFCKLVLGTINSIKFIADFVFEIRRMLQEKNTLIK